MQEYCGGLRKVNLHGQGTYRYASDAGAHFVYDGHFYVNHFEGYGRLLIDDGSSFEGLFRRSRRFGPGVLTYASGKQDVGYWNGQQLMRLLVTLDAPVVPVLAHSNGAVFHLLQFRTRLARSCKRGSCYQCRLQLNANVRNERSVFFDQACYAGCLGESNEGDPDDVIVWNNEQFHVDVLRHMMKHRYGETWMDGVSAVLAAIMRDERGVFQAPGVHEKACLRFLACCASGECSSVTATWRKYNLNPNVCDSSGNASVMYASARDQTMVLRELSALGARLDAVNDEGLTALNLCLLRYIASAMGVSDWEAAFLSPADRKNLSTQHIRGKLLKCVFSHSKDYCNVDTDPSQVYLLDISPSGSLRPPKPTGDQRSADAKVSCNDIALTIETLLHLGADPRNSNVPQPSFVLVLFCNNCDLLKLFLTKLEDINATFTADGLSLLHVLCSMPASGCAATLCNILLQHEINARSRTLATHWESARSAIIGSPSVGDDLPPDDGKTALHILAMREDFTFADPLENMNQVARLIANAHCDAVNDKYLGHTPLSLAVLWGNIRLVEVLLQCRADPNQRLDAGLGNALTVYALKRYSKGMARGDFATCGSIIDLLLRYWANPLLPVGNCANALEFCQSELQQQVQSNRKFLRFQRFIKQKLLQATRSAILRNIQGRIFFILLQKVLDGNIENYKQMTKYLHANDVLRIMRLCCQRRILDLSNEQHFLVMNILFEFTKIFGRVSAKRGNDKVTKNASNQDDVSLPNVEYSPEERIVEFELDLQDSAKYKTCFNCGLRTKKTLRACPTCGLLYYCSQECNLADNAANTMHICRLLFYNSEQLRFAADGAYQNAAEVMALAIRLPFFVSLEYPRCSLENTASKQLSDEKCCEFTQLIPPQPLTITTGSVSTRTSRKSMMAPPSASLNSKSTRKAETNFQLRECIIPKKMMRTCEDKDTTKTELISSTGGKLTPRWPRKKSAATPGSQTAFNREFKDTLSKLFPQHEFGHAMMAPFVCCSDSQFYYRFSRQRPDFMNTHM